MHLPLGPETGRGAWSGMRRTAIVLALAGGLLAGCSQESRTQYPEPPDQAAAAAFFHKTAAAYAAQRAESTEVALARFRELTEMMPGSPIAFYHLAAAYCRAGQPADAQAALGEAIDLGFADADQAQEDPDLQPLREMDGWDGLLERMRANEEQGRTALAALFDEPYRGTEPAFTSLDSLETYYGGLERRVYAATRIYAQATVAQMRTGVLMRKLAALDGYRRSGADATEVYQSWLQTLATQSRFADLDRRPWVLGRDQLIETTDHILSAYPDSSAAGVAALWRVRADWYGKVADDMDNMPVAQCDDTVAKLREVSHTYPDSPVSCQALAEAMEITAECSHRDIEKIRPLLEELEAHCSYNRESLGDYMYTVNEFRLMVHGAPDFTATDIDGRTWKLSELRGKVVLLDFWATWCGPCVAELPNLVKLREQYPDDRLVILGISLDQSARMPVESFRAWTAEKQMSWPQVLTGDGWSTPLARLYQVPAIPFPVLIGQEGGVLAAGGGARAEALQGYLQDLLGD